MCCSVSVCFASFLEFSEGAGESGPLEQRRGAVGGSLFAKGRVGELDALPADTIGMKDVQMVVRDSQAVLARLNVQVLGHETARTVAVAVADELATRGRPLNVRLEWEIAGDASWQFVHLATAD